MIPSSTKLKSEKTCMFGCCSGSKLLIVLNPKPDPEPKRFAFPGFVAAQKAEGSAQQQAKCMAKRRIKSIER